MTCLISTRLKSHGNWTYKVLVSWKVLEDAHKKVLKNHIEPLSVFSFISSVYLIPLKQLHDRIQTQIRIWMERD